MGRQASFLGGNEKNILAPVRRNYGGRLSQTKGFSLIELLVVIAIIGVLAVAGVVAYQAYMATVKSEVTENARDQVRKAIDEHIVVLQSDGGLSGPNEDWYKQFTDVASDGQCYRYVQLLVDDLNLKFKNQFDDEVHAFMDGHLITPKANGAVSIPPGSTIVFCGSPGSPVTASRIVTCTNSGTEAVDTTHPWASVFDPPQVPPLDPAIAPIPEGRCPHPGS